MADASRLLSSAVRCAKQKTYSSRRTLCSRPGLFFLPPVPFRTMPSERSSTVFRVWSSACGGQLHPALVRRRTHAMVLDRPRRSARRRACRLRSPSLSTRRKKPANLPLLQPTAALGLRHPGKKKKHETGARSIDVVLKSAGPCPFGPPSSCRCRAALQVYLVAWYVLHCTFRIDGRSSNFDRRLEGRGKQKKCCFGFWGGGVG